MAGIGSDEKNERKSDCARVVMFRDTFRVQEETSIQKKVILQLKYIDLWSLLERQQTIQAPGEHQVCYKSTINAKQNGMGSRRDQIQEQQYRHQRMSGTYVEYEDRILRWNWDRSPP